MTLLVLSLLSAGDKYGYEMIAALEAKSGHTFTLRRILYPILHGLETAGAVTAYEKEAPSGRKSGITTSPGPASPFWGRSGRSGAPSAHLVDAIVAEGEGSPLPGITEVFLCGIPFPATVSRCAFSSAPSTAAPP